MTTGDGGALACKSEDDFAKAKRLKWFGVDRDNPEGGNPWLGDVKEWGYKFNSNDISATIGLENIKHTERLNECFHRNGVLYTELLKDVSGVTLIKRDLQNDYSIFWAYCVLVGKRDLLIEKLAQEGVASGQIHPRNDVYSMFSMSKRRLPNLDVFSERELSLPCGWWVTEDEVRRICDIIRRGW